MRELTPDEKQVISQKAFELAGNIDGIHTRTAAFLPLGEGGKDGVVRVMIHAMTQEQLDRTIDLQRA
jgi:hypothetical protein